jgi:hypothetical protein
MELEVLRMWKLKVLIQFILSKLPMGETVNYWLQTVNKSHSEEKIKGKIITIVRDLKKIDEYLPLEGAIAVEIGTGWEAVGPILLYMMGVKQCFTYDHVRHVREKTLTGLIRCIKAKLPDISEITGIQLNILTQRLSALENSPNSVFSSANIIYHAPGDAAKTGLDNNSVDLVYSNVVLEHVPEKAISDLTVESKRILKKSGVAYHSIGLHDHYVGLGRNVTNVNFLKYSEPLWSFFIQNNISYHNRLREKQFIEIFTNCGGKIIWKESFVDQSDIEALRHMKIDKAFSGMSYEELAVRKSKMIISF